LCWALILINSFFTFESRSAASEDIGDQDSDIDEKDSSFPVGEENDFYGDIEDHGDEDDVENIELVEASEQEGNNRTESNMQPAPALAPSVHNQKTGADVKKLDVQEKPNQTPAISVHELGEL